jgi:hypothetical protein
MPACVTTGAVRWAGAGRRQKNENLQNKIKIAITGVLYIIRSALDCLSHSLLSG